jgi:mannose-6-phosphate isomerase
MGAHPMAPSEIEQEGAWQRLDAVIAAAPERWLGRRALDRFGPQLPFLLKVLAAAEPLSLQAHPTLEQAREGFAREEALGIPREAPDRCYRDASHKPELIVALTPFHALCGFRAIERTRQLFELLQCRELDFVRQGLRAGDAGLEPTFRRVLGLSAEESASVVSATVAACRSARGAYQEERAWALRLADRYPGDSGVVAALFLNLVTLAPGEGLYLPAGNLHAYLEGVGVEVMASSDNVLRGGLTPKHVDVEELCRVLRFEDSDVSVLQPIAAAGEARYQTLASEFALSRVLAGAELSVQGPEIVLCVRGSVELASVGGSLALGQGESALVSAADERYGIRGSGATFRATIGA